MFKIEWWVGCKWVELHGHGCSSVKEAEEYVANYNGRLRLTLL